MEAVQVKENEILVPLEIKIPDINIQSGTVAASWCVSPELLKMLAEQGNHDPQIVIITATANRLRYHVTKESRQVASLKDGLTYIEFRSSGENNVWAFVPVQFKKAKDVKTRFLSRSDGSFATTVLDYNGEDFDWQYKTNPMIQLAPPLKVILPEGAFAKEPSAFEKNWVNWLFRTKCVDQCAFRRRRMFAYTLQVFPFLGSMLLKFLGTFAAAFVGSRNFSFKLLANPLNYSFLDADELFGDGTVFIKQIPDSENPFSGNCVTPDSQLQLGHYVRHITRKFWALPFMPLSLLVEGLFVLGVISSHFILLWIVLGLVAAVISFFVATAAIGMYQERQEAEELKQTPWYLKEEEMDFMMCSRTKKITKISDLPSSKRTLKLRFLDMKSRVCRPFSV